MFHKFYSPLFITNSDESTLESDMEGFLKGKLGRDYADITLMLDDTPLFCTQGHSCSEEQLLWGHV